MDLRIRCIAVENINFCFYKGMCVSGNLIALSFTVMYLLKPGHIGLVQIILVCLVSKC